MSACFCMGPQNGQPRCPCQMRDVEIRNGRYVRVEDLGPAPQLPIEFKPLASGQDLFALEQARRATAWELATRA